MLSEQFGSVDAERTASARDKAMSSYSVGIRKNNLDNGRCIMVEFQVSCKMAQNLIDDILTIYMQI